MGVEYYLQFCDRSFTPTEVILKTCKPLVVEALLKGCQDVAQWAIGRGRELVLIYLEGCSEPYMIEAWMATTDRSPNPDPQPSIRQRLNWGNRDILIPELDITREEAEGNEKAVYVTRNNDHTILYANPTALRANNKAPEEIIGKDCIALWEDEVLVRLDNQLRQDKRLIEYEYPGFRWATDGEGRTWRRTPYIFISNYWLLEDYKDTGVSCRYCEIQQAVPASQRELLQIR